MASAEPATARRRAASLVPRWWAALPLVALGLVAVVPTQTFGSIGRSAGFVVAGLAMLRVSIGTEDRRWGIVALGCLTAALADSLWLAGVEEQRDLGVAAIVLVVGYLIQAMGFTTLRADRGVGSLLDGMVVALSALSFGVAIVVIPYLESASASDGGERAIASAMGVAMVLRATAVVRIAIARHPMTRGGQALLAAIVVDFVASITWSRTAGGARAFVVAVLWALAGSFLVLAVRHAGGLAAANDRRQVPGITRARVATLAVSAVLALLVLWVERAQPLAWLLLVLSMVIFVLVIARLLVVAEELDNHRHRLDHIAHHDPVTGLANRAQFEARIETLRALPAADRPDVGVLYIDLDDFKEVNDRWGHEAGDEVLAEVAERLSASTRDSDVVARLGGDEFVVLITGEGVEDSARRVAVRIQHRLTPPLRVSRDGSVGDVGLGASIGVLAPVGDLGTLLRDADVAMYRAKRSGKGRVAFFGRTADGELSDIEGSSFRRAVDSGGLRVAYQPVVDLRSGAVIGVEALLRRRSWDGSESSPAELVDAAERDGSMVELGRWVLRQAADEAAAWKREFGDRAPWVSVNLTRLEIEQDDLHDAVTEVLRTTGASSRQLIIEVAADTLMALDAPSSARLAWLRSAGVRVAADDVGLAASGIGQLSGDLVDVIKLDRAYVTAAIEDDAVIVNLLSEAERLGAMPIAEGIETESELRGVRELGAVLGQGFLFSSARRPQVITDLLRGQNERRMAGASMWSGGPGTSVDLTGRALLVDEEAQSGA